MAKDLSYISRNLAAVRAALDEIAARTGDPPAKVIPVTKSASDEEVLALCACGVPAIAENRVPNYRARRDLLAGAGFTVPLHLIGSLQTNKVKYIAEDVALIQSLDSLRLAEEIARRAAAVGRKIPVLIEINSGREANKGGILPEDLFSFRASLEHLSSSLDFAGLMTMAPACETEEEYRPYFRTVRALFDRMKEEGGFTLPCPQLSMGMSDSWRVAAEEGATMVRIGRFLFQQSE